MKSLYPKMFIMLNYGLETIWCSQNVLYRQSDTLVLRFVKGSDAIRIATSGDGAGGFFLILAYGE